MKTLKSMVKLTQQVVAAAALAVMVSVSAQAAEIAPDWTLMDKNGKQVNFYQNSQDRIAVLMFWATWCPYCRKLLPHLQTLVDEFKGQPVDFYALNVWEEGDSVQYMQDGDFTLTLLMDADDVAEAYDVKGTPGLMVVDDQHQIQYVRASGIKDTEAEAAVRTTINRLLQQ